MNHKKILSIYKIKPSFDRFDDSADKKPPPRDLSEILISKLSSSRLMNTTMKDEKESKNSEGGFTSKSIK